ncbi:MAG: YihY/virulence factor BrkB family protein [Candidatus Saccharimonadales bacterium]
MNIIEKTLQGFDSFQQRHRKISFFYAVIKKYGEDEAGYQAALMAYYAFLSLFPLLLVLTTVVKMFLHSDSDLRRSIIDGATQYFPLIGNDLEKSVHGVGGTGLAIVIGVLFSLYGARGVADVFRSVVNHVWEVPYVRRIGFPWSLLRSLRMIIVGGVGLLAAPLISGYAASAGHGPLFWVASAGITLAILFGVFLYLIHTSLPSKTTFQNMWPSALLAAIGLQILQGVGVLLVKNQLKHLDSLYGTFAVVLGLLFWLYLQAQVIVYALEAGTVRALKLYPRSFDARKRPSEADNMAYGLYSRRSQFHDDPAAPDTK